MKYILLSTEYHIWDIYQQSLIVILPSMELYMGCTDIEENIDCVTLICCGLLGVLKTTWFRIYANSLIINYNSALNDYLTIDNIKERDIMRKHSFVGRILCLSLLAFTYFSCLIYGVTPFLNNQDNFINITNGDTVSKYAIPSRCALEYFNFPTSLYKISCLIEAVILIIAATANLGNIYLIYMFILCFNQYHKCKRKFIIFHTYICLLVLLILCIFFLGYGKRCKDATVCMILYGKLFH